MRTITAVIYITRVNPISKEDVEIEIALSGTYSPYIPARISGPSDQCYPAEGGEVELESFESTEHQHLYIELTEDEKKRAIQALSDALEEDEPNEPEYDHDHYENLD